MTEVPSTAAGNSRRATIPCRVASWLSASCLIALVFAPAASYSEVYRSVDENGAVTYSAIKPTGRPVNPVRVKIEQPQPGASETLQDMVTAADEARAKRLKKSEEQAAEEARGKKKQERCERARSNLERMEQIPRVFHVNNAGDRERVSEEQRQADMTRLREIAAKNCN